jgi:hypothetical protein
MKEAEDPQPLLASLLEQLHHYLRVIAIARGNKL